MISETGRAPAEPEPRPLTRAQRKARTRQTLLEAARRVLARRGLAGMTTREVAQEANVAAGTFFVHFPDVNTLVNALLDEHVSAALAAALRTLPARLDAVGSLVHVAGRLYDSYDVEPELSRQYLTAALFHPDPAGPTDVRLAEFSDWAASVIGAAVERGDLPPIDPGEAFTAFFSLYFGLLVLGLRGEMSRERQLALLGASLRRLLKAEESP